MQVKVRFDAQQAVEELRRLDLLEPHGDDVSGPTGLAVYRVVEPRTAYKNLKADWCVHPLPQPPSKAVGARNAPGTYRGLPTNAHGLRLLFILWSTAKGLL